MRIRDWYFQGWERRVDDDGKKTFVYTGEYYGFPGGAKPLKIPAAVLIAALLGMYLLVAFLPSPGGMWHYAAPPQLIEILPLVYLAIGAVQFLRAPERMTYRAFHTSWLRIKRASLWSLILTGCMVLAEIIYLFAVPEAELSRELLYLLGELACAALSAALCLFVRRHPYTQTTNTDQIQEKKVNV